MIRSHERTLERLQHFRDFTDRALALIRQVLHLESTLCGDGDNDGCGAGLTQVPLPTFGQSAVNTSQTRE